HPRHAHHRGARDAAGRVLRHPARLFGGTQGLPRPSGHGAGVDGELRAAGHHRRHRLPHRVQRAAARADRHRAHHRGLLRLPLQPHRHPHDGRAAAADRPQPRGGLVVAGRGQRHYVPAGHAAADRAGVLRRARRGVHPLDDGHQRHHLPDLDQLDADHRAHPGKHDRAVPGPGRRLLDAGGGHRGRRDGRAEPPAAPVPHAGPRGGSQPAGRLMAAVGIRLEHLTKRFHHRVQGEVFAARDVSLTVAPGEFVTLLGPSGCGKTTTLRMIAGFETPDTGRVFIGDEDVTALLANRRNIGFVFQNYALFPHLTVFENVAYGLRVQGRPMAALGRAVADVLAMVGLQGYDRQFPQQLSGGEQQRVALARAIVIRPRVLLFDEPLSNLDAQLRVRMRSEIRALQQALSITAVYVTHDQEEAMAISDRIAVMSRGTIVQEGSAEELYQRPASEFVARFIGRVNLVRARVVAVDAAGVEVEVAGHRLRVVAPPALPAPGDTVRLVLRPETIELATAGGEGPAGIVAERTFLGEKAEYQVRVGDETLQVTRYSGAAPRFAPGSAVTVRLPAEG